MEEYIVFSKLGDGYIARIAGMRYQVCGFGFSQIEAAKHLMLQIEKCKEILNIINKKRRKYEQ